MAPIGEMPVPRAPLALESISATVLYSSDRTRIYRAATASGEHLVCKQALGAGAVERTCHERTVLALLHGVAGVPELAPGAADRAPEPGGQALNVITLCDHGGVPLAQLLRHERLTMPAVLQLALALARIVAAVHARGVVHHDINPANILLSGPQRAPILIDFKLATAATGNGHAAPASGSVGTLAYVAPEHISSGSRPADHRADMYALGATLYELAVGHPPFQQADLDRLIHEQRHRTPALPSALVPAVPALLSAIIVRLLEKEPDRRYQGAEGLAHDLARLSALLTRNAQPDFELGLYDFPPRLAAPAHLVGRARELRALTEAFGHAMDGTLRAVLLSGPAGVGKQKLVAQLQPVVAAHGGYFISGKFHQTRQDRQSDGLYMAFRALGRRLLAEPEAVLAHLRARLLDALGVNAALMASSSPELAIILDVPVQPWSDTADDANARLLAGVTTLLRTIITPQRPLVMAIDDVQWAHPFSLAILDAILRDADLPGLLLVVAWRNDGLAPGHPLIQLLPDWAGRSTLSLALGNLAPRELGALLAQMLRLPEHHAADLASDLAEHTGGNPYDTMELVHTLRQQGLLRLAGHGWTWDRDQLKRHVSNGGAASLLQQRLERLPAGGLHLLRTMGCLGGALRTDQLAAAAGLAPDAIDALLAPALDDGLLAQDTEVGGAPLVRFRHERVQQAVQQSVAPANRAALHIAIARRLAPLSEHVALAAAQYLAALDLIETVERPAVIALLRRAAQLTRQGNDAECGRLLHAALVLLGEPATSADRQLQHAMRCELHAALIRAGRADEADSLYATMAAGASAPLDLIAPACLQMSTLMLRRRLDEALALGMQMLDRLGFPLPQFAGTPDIVAELGSFEAWLRHEQASASDQSSHAVMNDARIAAVVMVFERCVRAAFFIDDRLLAALALGAWRLWRDHGLCAAMVAPVSFIGIVAIRQRNDYQLGYDASRFLLGLSEQRGFVLEAARVRALFAVSHTHWREPLEQCLAHARQAHAELMRGGDLLAACLPLLAVVSCSMECTPTLAAAMAEATAALALAARANNLVAAPAFRAVLALTRELADSSAAPVALAEDPASFTPVGRCNWHVARAIHAALLDLPDQLDVHSAAAFATRDVLYGGYGKVLATLLRAFALASQAQQHAPGARAPLLAAAAPLRTELARWATDAPDNAGHLLLWLDAEVAWAGGDVAGAARAYDDALSALDTRQRAWHRALITERAGLFHLAHGLPRAGRRLLAEACDCYQAWGAAAKVARLERAHNFLRDAPTPMTMAGERRAQASTDSLQLLALLRASQALSSETSIARLHARVAEQLGAMTGADQVRMLLPRAGSDHWQLAEALDGDGQAVEDAAAAGLLPLSAFRYVARTRVALVVDDATRDERFSTDPHWHGMRHCSLLLLPVLNRGELRAILMLENRQRSGAFAADRLEAVQLIAGQLAVSLDNAMLYASLERKVAERTLALETANRELAALSITDALTGLANRRHFDQVLGTEWRRALRASEPLGAAMIDIDQFKLYNDHYGHQQGDACLRQVAQALAGSVRQGVDLAARYGGEEFAIILPGADLAEARIVAERARAAVAALALPHLPAGHGIVTVSIGVAAMVPHADLSAAAVFGAADAALYQAKQLGRNRVMPTD